MDPNASVAVYLRAIVVLLSVIAGLLAVNLLWLESVHDALMGGGGTSAGYLLMNLGIVLLVAVVVGTVAMALARPRRPTAGAATDPANHDG